MSELIRDNCGVGFVWDSSDAIKAVREGVDNRGDNAEGYGTRSDGSVSAVRSYFGLMDEQALRTLLRYEPGKPIAIHTRYKTRGDSSAVGLLTAAHPHTIGGVDIFQGNHRITYGAEDAMVHNGTVSFDFSSYNLTLRTGCDTEPLLCVHHARGAEYVLKNIPASYSVVTMKAGEDFATAYRDRYGRRPLWLGVDNEGRFIIMSEDKAIKIIGGQPIREVKPGEMIRVYKNNFEPVQVVPAEERLCYFEVNYLARRLSFLWETLRKQDVNIGQLRSELGEELFREHPPIGGIKFVTHLPKTPLDAAIAYAAAAKLPRRELFYKLNSKRAFQQATREDREKAIGETLFVDQTLDPEEIGRYFLAIDDSIVRGTNLPNGRIKAEERGFKMKQVGIYTPIVGGQEYDGKEIVHLGCDHGVDMPRKVERFIASRVGRDPKKIADALGVEYVGFLSVEGMVNVFERHGIRRQNLCLECVRARNF